MPAVSIIVVNWNRWQLLRECLESVEQQTVTDRELIVVDNGSTDGSVESVRRGFPRARVVALPTNRGFAGGANIGIRHARGAYIALLNNDAVAEPGWLAALVDALNRHADVGSCASKMLFYEDRERIESAGILFFTAGVGRNRGRMAIDGPPFDTPADIVGACAGAALYRRSMLEDAGLFDEDFAPAYFEDVDLSLRAQLRGHRCLYVPSAVVYHRLSATLGHQSSASVYLWSRNQWYPLVKNLPGRLIYKHVLEIAVYGLLKLLWQLVCGSRWPYVLGQLAACRALPTMLSKRRVVQRGRTVSIQALDAMFSHGLLRSEITRRVGSP